MMIKKMIGVVIIYIMMFSIFLPRIAMSSGGELFQADHGTRLNRGSQDRMEGKEGKFQLQITGDVFPYLEVTVINPEIMWDILGGTGTAEACGPEIRVDANCAFDINLSSVDDFTNKDVAPDPETGANIIKTWYASSLSSTDSPFQGGIATTIIDSHTGLFSPPGHGIVESVPMTDGLVVRYLWNKIEVQINDTAGAYKDSDGLWILISPRLE